MNAPASASRKKPGPAITDSVLEKSALFYLERYAASSGQLRRVLLRRIKRALDPGWKLAPGVLFPQKT